MAESPRRNDTQEKRALFSADRIDTQIDIDDRESNDQRPGVWKVV